MHASEGKLRKLSDRLKRRFAIFCLRSRSFGSRSPDRSVKPEMVDFNIRYNYALGGGLRL